MRIYITLALISLGSVYSVYYELTRVEGQVVAQKEKIKKEIKSNAKKYIKKKIAKASKKRAPAKIRLPKHVKIPTVNSSHLPAQRVSDIPYDHLHPHHPKKPDNVRQYLKNETVDTSLTQQQIDHYIERLEYIQKVPNQQYKLRLLEAFQNEIQKNIDIYPDNNFYFWILEEVDLAYREN